MSQLASIILAAGKGTRMKSRLPKVLHMVCGKPMLSHVISSAEKAGVTRNVVVIGHEAELVKEAIGSGVEWVYQIEQLGTGHAVAQAEPALADFSGTVVILCGDTPLITEATLKEMINTHLNSGNSATVLTVEMDNPFGYGRIVRDNSGQVSEIVEHRDATDMQVQIKEVNTGIYCFNSKKLFAGLKKLQPVNAQGEYYLTDVLKILRDNGDGVGAVTGKDPREAMGINNRIQLAEAEKSLRLRVLDQLMIEGITIVDPQNTYIDSQVVIGPDSIVYPGSIIEGNCQLGSNCKIGPYTRLKDVQAGNGLIAENSIIIEASIGDLANIGPYAYIRPGTVLKDNVKVGDFVEIKKSVIGTASKVPHLSYIGDSEIGARVNIGAGTITCNYDGTNKSKTIIGDGAFIGSNSNLVAPVEIGKDALIGAGSTISKNVPDEALGIERSKQEIYNKWKARKNKK